MYKKMKKNKKLEEKRKTVMKKHKTHALII